MNRVWRCFAAFALMVATTQAAWAEPAPPSVVSPQLKEKLSHLQTLANEADEKGDRTRELAATAAWVTLAESELGKDSTQYATAIYRHAQTLRDLSRFREAEELTRTALSIRQRRLGPTHPNTLRAMTGLGDVLNDQGKWAEADPILREAARLRAQVLGSKHEDTLYTLGLLAHNLIDSQRFEEAESISRSVYEVEKATLGPNNQTTLATLWILAHSLDHLRRFEESEELKRHVLEQDIIQLGADHGDVLMDKNNLAFTLGLADKFAEAEKLHREVLAERRKSLRVDDPDIGQSLSNLGDSLSWQGRDAEAEGYYREALTIYRKAFGDQHPYTRATAGKLTNNLLRRPGTAASALDPARFTVAGIRAVDARSSGRANDEAQHDRDALTNRDHFLNLADAAWVQSPGSRTALQEEAFAAIQNADSASASRAVAQMAARSGAEESDKLLGVLARKRQSFSEQWQELDRAQSSAYSDLSSEGAARLNAIAAERLRVEAELDQIDRTIEQGFPDYQALVRPTALTAAAIQSMLGRDEAVLVVAPGRYGTHLVGITRSGVRWLRSDLTRSEVDRAVGKLRRDLNPNTMRGDDYPPFDRATAHSLYGAIVAPMAELFGGKKALYVAAQGSLSTIPFSVLVTKPPTGSDDDPAALRSSAWLADKYALIQLPSVQSLKLLRGLVGNKSVQRFTQSFVGFGNPVLAGASTTRGMSATTEVLPSEVFRTGAFGTGRSLADPAVLKSLASLPGTAPELDRMRSALRAPQSAVHLGHQATESAVKAMDLSATRVLALATHGLMAGELPGDAEPGLVLTPPKQPTAIDDGYLSASDVAELRLNADWVILSACNTAAGDGKGGSPGLSGLARAFFYAGARSLLVSHWPVRDDVAPQLTVNALRLYRQGKSKAVALQKAMRSVRTDPNDPSRAHPFSWAPFTIVGEGL